MEVIGSDYIPRFDEWYSGDNRRLFSILSVYLNLSPDYVTPEMINEMTGGDRRTSAFALAHLSAAACGLDVYGNPSDRRFFNRRFLPCFREEPISDYASDSYFGTIEFPSGEQGRWSFGKKVCRPYECFVCGDPDVRRLPGGGFEVSPRIGFFSEEYVFPAVSENGREWMTLMPNETLTTLPAVGASRGRVLTFGLGLGYFAFHASEKDDVGSVTVVERSDDAIKIFRDYLLPQFPHKEKIDIVKADAFEFAERGMSGYDTVFCDIWHDPSDGVGLYLRMKEYEKKNPGPAYHYWIEKTLKLYI
ncbi:MAG: class I SAM-dependent methyltransferase [Clostridia bacterium]|nr:class I SAM-dependent methyltransferase [Clostridia bacterium]